MKRAAAAAISTVVAALMVLVQPASATSEVTVAVTDREGDLGGAGYVCYLDEDGDWMWDPWVFWSDTSPIGNAGYLDMLGAWVTYECSPSKVKSIEIGMTLAAPLDPEVTDLPVGVKMVRWAWFFYQELPEFHGDYYIYVDWDGEEFAVYLADYASTDKELNSDVPLIAMDFESCVQTETFVDIRGIERMNIVVTTSEREIIDLILTCNYWFFETQYVHSEGFVELTMRGWWASDMTDMAYDPSTDNLPIWPVPEI
jgi:hypothetical protein